MTDTSPSGHRARLRQRFQLDPASLSDGELLELLLTYAIPRVDVAPQAAALLGARGDLSSAVEATAVELTGVSGIGEQAATLLMAIGEVMQRAARGADGAASNAKQPALFEEEPSGLPEQALDADERESSIRTFANDEAANALAFLPQAANFSDIEAFRRHLAENLAYNSESTRRRRANYIIDRYFRRGRLDSPLAFYAAHCSSEADLKPVLFYHTALAEPLVRSIAEDLVWPALPLGRVSRDEVREHVLRLLPDLRIASQAKVLQALFNLYEISGVAARDGASLRVYVRPGALEAFVYTLMAEFPRPGMYSFDAMEGGPLRRWLLWDRDWMRRQLYNLQDMGIVAKVSDIDTVRQFTISLDQPSALRLFFERTVRPPSVLREQGPDGEA